MRPPVLALPAVLIVSLVAAGCSADGHERDAAPVGTVVEATSAEGGYVEVHLPLGRVDLTIGSPRDDLPVYDERYDHVADGASFVGVGWSWDFTSAYAAMADNGDDTVVPHVWLVADGREYSLDEAMLRTDGPGDSPLEFDGGLYVAVEGEPSELAIKVEYDGVEQLREAGSLTDDVTGPAAALYRSPDDLARHPVSCGVPQVEGRRPGDQDVCRLDVARVPWADAVGWVAGEEDRWLVVDATVFAEAYPDPRPGEPACGALEVRDVRYEVDGEQPVHVSSRDEPGAAPTGRDLVVAPVGRGPDPVELVVTVTQQYADPGREPGCPAGTVTRWTVEV